MCIRDRLIGCVIRSDYSLNETKIRNHIKATNLKIASDNEIIKEGFIPGYISPINVNNIS